MPKVYEPMPEGGDLFLRLSYRVDDAAELHVVNERGEHVFGGSLIKVRRNGIRLMRDINTKTATRAGFSPEALDSNGRLKVIGQESVEAEKLRHTKFQCDIAGDDALIFEGAAYGSLDVSVMRGSHGFAVNISPSNIRVLAARINRHVAFLDAWDL